MILKEKIEQALKCVIDPGTKLDIMRMKLVRDIEVSEGGRVSLTFQPSSPVCPMAFKIAYEIKKTVQHTEGVNEVKINISGFDKADEVMTALEEADN